MTCPRIGCGALLREDRQFRVEMETQQQPQRRFVCHAGHSLTLGVPDDVTVRMSMGAPIHLPNQSRNERVCARCGDMFHGTKRQKFCSSVCTRAADQERNKKYVKTNGQRGRIMAGEELRIVRAIPRLWNAWKRNGTPPVPYAARSKRLATKWV